VGEGAGDFTLSWFQWMAFATDSELRRVIDHYVRYQNMRGSTLNQDATRQPVFNV
jgi:hypothetical protein